MKKDIIKYYGIVDLVDLYNKKHKITKKEAEIRIKDMLAMMEELLVSDEKQGFQFVNFLTLLKVVRLAKVGRNPKDVSKTYIIPESIGIKTTLGKEFDKKLNKK